MTLETLLPDIAGLKLQRVSKTSGSILLQLGISIPTSRCPNCQKVSSRIHSCYWRKVTDLPWADLSVVIQLNARKFFCENSDCEQKVFTERLGPQLSPFSRKTKRMRDLINAIGCVAGGNAGASLAKILGMPISASTVLRKLHSLEDSDFESPKVLGVDD